MEALQKTEQWNIPRDLLAQGKSVITSHEKIADNHLFVIEPSGQSYLIRVEYKENVRLRELTPNEYQIARTIYE